MRILKPLLYTLAGLLGVAVLAVAAVLALVDGGFVKSRLEQVMKEKQRTLSIEGEPRLSLFPVAGLSLGRTTLSEPSSKDLFLELQSAEVAVRVLPLLSGALVVDKLSAHGVRVNVRRLKDGRMNFDDLREEHGREPAKSEKKDAKDEKGAARGEERRRDLPKLVVGEIDIEKVRVAFADEATGQEVAVEDFTLKLARLSGDAPSPLTLNANVTGKRPEVSLKARAGGQVKLDLARGLLEVNGVELMAAGTLDRDAMSASLSAPRISVTPDKATGSAVTGSLRIAGPERKLEAKLDVGAVEGNATSLSIPQLALRFDAAADGGVLRGAISTPLRANLKQKTWELPKLSADLALTHPKLPQIAGKGAARLPIEATVKADHEKQTLSVNAAANAEDLDFRLELGAKRFMPLDASFELNSKRMNLDRYPFLLGGVGGAKKQEDRIDLSGLAGRTVNGKLRIGSLQAHNVKLADVSADVKLARGALEVSPLRARLYEGKLDGAVSANAKGNQVAIRQSLQGVQINPLLRDLAQKDILEGKGDVSIDVTGAGATVPALKRSLAGNARLQLKDGAYKGINLAEVFRKARAALGSKSAQVQSDAAVQSGASAQKTDFSELSASFVIRGGVAHNEDLALRSPFVRAGGSGNLDIAASTLDYTVKPTVVATATGQQGRDDAAGLTVPVRIHGPLDALRYDVDYRGLASDSLRERLNQRLNERLGGKADGKPEDGKPAPSPQDQLRDQVRDRLKGILGR